MLHSMMPDIIPMSNMMAYSIDPKEAYLSEQGIENIKGELAREIFRQDHISIYQKQTEYRELLREQGRESVAEIVAQINAGNYQNSKVEALLVQLSERLSHTSGKKVYGYLKADVKAIVDEIVTELATDERIQKLYDLWYPEAVQLMLSMGVGTVREPVEPFAKKPLQILPKYDNMSRVYGYLLRRRGIDKEVLDAFA